eukprot:8019557-Alexandrium_andersonii.AAC.1
MMSASTDVLSSPYSDAQSIAAVLDLARSVCWQPRSVIGPSKTSDAIIVTHTSAPSPVASD